VSDTDPGSRDVLVERTAIQSWAGTHDAVPVRSEEGTGAPIDVATDVEVDDRIEWSTFFDAFENARLAMLVDGDDVEFVNRDRIAETGDDHPIADDARGEPDAPADPAEQRREIEAADQENIDNHRDEEPFQS
jgi:hypothetical protein